MNNIPNAGPSPTKERHSIEIFQLSSCFKSQTTLTNLHTVQPRLTFGLPEYLAISQDGKYQHPLPKSLQVCTEINRRANIQPTSVHFFNSSYRLYDAFPIMMICPFEIESDEMVSPVVFVTGKARGKTVSSMATRSEWGNPG